MLKDAFTTWFENEEMKRELRDAVRPVGNYLYQELFFYFLIVSLYFVLLFVFVLAILFVIIHNTMRITSLQNRIEKHLQC